VIGFTLNLLGGFWLLMFFLVGAAKHFELIDDTWAVVLARTTIVCLMCSASILFGVGLTAAIAGVG
jgi:hypothetical protein